MQVKKKPRNAAAKKIQKSPPKEKRTKKEQTEQPLLKRVIFGEERPDLTELEAGSTTILDILAPTTVDTKSKDYIVVDGVYHTYLYITGYGYATTVGSCWLAPLVEAGEGVNMSFLVKRQSKEKILSKIAQTTMVNRSRMRDVGDTRQDYEELDSAINSGLYLKDVMNRQGEDFYYMHTLIEVTAPDPETLEQRATEVEKLCVSVDMIARRCDYKNEQAFLSSLPILALDPDIERKARRNALTSGVAAAFPFASYELSDHNGIFLGLNLYNRSPVFLDPYDDYKYTNGNWWIGGSTGAGKTVTLQCLGGRLRQQGKRVIIIAPKKGHEFRPLCEKLGGLYLRMSPSSKDCPNLMAIRRKSLVYGDNVIEKHGINRDSTGDREKTRYLCGKQGIFTRDRALIRPGFIRQLETRASTRSASFFHALGSPGRPHNGGGEAGAYRTRNGAKPLKQGHLRAKRGPLGPSRKSQQQTKRTGFAAHGHSIAETAPEGKRASCANGALIRA